MDVDQFPSAVAAFDGGWSLLAYFVIVTWM